MRHSVGAVGNQSAGHDADRCAWLDAFGCHLAGGKILDDLQSHRRIGDVIGANRVTVHCRVVRLRHVGRGDDVLAQHAAERFRENDILAAEESDFGEDALLRFFDADHALAGAGCLEGRHRFTTENTESTETSLCALW